MDWLIPLAAKSFLIAGGALLLLHLFKHRSASDRSWVAHLALAGLLLLPVATIALPRLDIAGPEFLVGKADQLAPATLPSAAAADSAIAPAAAAAAPSAAPGAGRGAIDWPFWTYAVPAGLLVLLTLIAIARLFLLKARAVVLVDAPWLTALARAQKRMGFKHGTALLTSNELPSPISWGVVRPIILLNSQAAESHNEAEAIITHELAHVANLDWAKLLLARIVTALFWFNPLVWLLAREAHQLREEAADDAVLATDIEDTDYAKLLVGVARHECRGLLIGAHGVAPARNSLSRRVKRVLDSAVKRAPGGWRWGSAAAFFAAGMAVPVAAINLVPAAPAAATDTAFAQSASPYYPEPHGASADARTDNVPGIAKLDEDGTVTLVSKDGKTVRAEPDGETVIRAADGSTVTINAADWQGRRRMVVESPDGRVVAYADARALAGASVAMAHPHSSGARAKHKEKTAIDRANEMKAVGVTPEYVAAIRQVAPQLGLDHDDIVAMRRSG